MFKTIVIGYISRASTIDKISKFRPSFNHWYHEKDYVFNTRACPTRRDPKIHIHYKILSRQ